jgi:D-alanyl-D-alanine carboxypeptidase (penicillin-binding protein 5/6)
MKKIVMSALTVGLIFFTFTAQTIQPPQGSDFAARAAVVMCFDTGEVLFGHNEHMRWHPASVMKMMTVYMVYDAIDAGHFTLGCIVPISAYTRELSVRRGLSNVALSRNGNYTVSELLDTVIVISACGAANALAEKVGGGSLHEYFRMANAKAAEWGIDARINNTFGGIMNANHFTPYALATLTRNTILRFPEVLERTGASYIIFRGRRYDHHVPTRYPGMDGFKTGNSATTRYNFIGTAEQDGIRLISVVMGSSRDRRFDDTAILLDYGFAVSQEQRLQTPLVLTANLLRRGIKLN